jgi:surface antigen
MITSTPRTALLRRTATLVTSAAIAAGGASMLAAPAHAAGGYGPYVTVASPSLSARTAPSTSATVVQQLAYHSTIYIACQTSGTSVGGSVVWDRLTSGVYVFDYWTNTPGYLTWTTSIPRCGTTAPAPAPTATFGKTVTYNEGASGQCTWWAINEFHGYTGLYPNLVAPGNNGDAQFWAGNATYNGWTVTATPRVHSIAVFPPYKNSAGAVGHVAWVTAVSGTQITITEMNFVAWNKVDTRTLTPDVTVRYILAP